MRRTFVPLVLSVGCLCASLASADTTVRIASWNITNYAGGRVQYFQTAIYGEYEGRSMSPDIIFCQEVLSQAGVNAFLSLLNTAPNSPGDWTAAQFIDGRDTDNALFYRTSVVEIATDFSPTGVTVVATGAPYPYHPRDINRYDLRFAAGTPAETTLAIYSSHMKAGSSSDDKVRRLDEAETIRADAEQLPSEWHFLLGGDFNIQSSGQSAYVELVGSQTNNDGRFFDPINTPGSWNNSSSYRYVHTQDPATAMDDRHDQILVSVDLIDGVGADYIGEPTIPYSTTTWDDPHHSYRSWGNDGSSYDQQLRTTGNTMVGPEIAQALIYSALGGGHLPVYLDLRIPPCLGDGECDGYANAEDWLSLADCMTGPYAQTGFTPPSAYCASHGDWDSDGDVDLVDLAAFQATYADMQP